MPCRDPLQWGITLPLDFLIKASAWRIPSLDSNYVAENGSRVQKRQQLGVLDADGKLMSSKAQTQSQRKGPSHLVAFLVKSLQVWQG